jgi:hypothetical protein
MASHSDIINKAKSTDGNLFSLNAKSEVFVYQMKLMNALLLERLPNFKLGMPFFPNSEQLASRLAEAYVNEGRTNNLNAASEQALKDKKAIEAAVKAALG